MASLETIMLSYVDKGGHDKETLIFLDNPQLIFAAAVQEASVLTSESARNTNAV